MDQFIKEAEAALFNGPGIPFKFSKFAVPELSSGEILVQNLYTTICGSDLHTYSGLRKETCPTVLGHEIVGRILKLHPDHPGKDLRDQKLSIGDRITWTVFSSDPASANSLAGIPQKGDQLFKYGHALAKTPDVFHGGLAERCVLKTHTGILKLSEEIPLPVAATLNCSVSTVAAALRLSGDPKGKRVLITGMGHLGVTCAAMCRDAGAKWIVAADLDESRLDQSLDFGVDELFNLQQGDADLAAAEAFDLIIDMSGSPGAMELGISRLAIGGTAVWVGAVFKTRKVEIDPEFIIRSLISIRGLHNYNLSDFCKALEFMERNWNKYPFEHIVEREFKFRDVECAFKYALENKPLRVGVRI